MTFLTRLDRRGRSPWVVHLAICLIGLTGCHPEPPAGTADASPPQEKEGAKDSSAPEGEAGVALTAEQVQKIGVATTGATATDYAAEIAGYGLVVPHDTIAAAVAEIATAQAAQLQSRASAARAQRLAGTPGAMSADSVESAARQVATDSAALVLAQRRLSAVVGMGAPSGIADGSQLQDLASGRLKLLRATFPLGSLQGATPAGLRAARLDGAGQGVSRSPQGWTMHPVWTAPADGALPGRSFFALLKADDVGEGERLLVWAPGSGSSQRGVTVPDSSLVISGGKYWCYVEQKPGLFVRREVATDRPVPTGYFVTAGIVAGDKIVVAAASLLLAHEMNSSTEAE